MAAAWKRHEYNIIKVCWNILMFSKETNYKKKCWDRTSSERYRNMEYNLKYNKIVIFSLFYPTTVATTVQISKFIRCIGMHHKVLVYVSVRHTQTEKKCVALNYTKHASETLSTFLLHGCCGENIDLQLWWIVFWDLLTQRKIYPYLDRGNFKLCWSERVEVFVLCGTMLS